MEKTMTYTQIKTLLGNLLPDLLSHYQSGNWDMNLTLGQLISHNTICKVDREYHEKSNMLIPFCLYLKHPYQKEANAWVCVSINDDGFYYFDDVEDSLVNLKYEKTLDVMTEMYVKSKAKVVELGLDKKELMEVAVN